MLKFINKIYRKSNVLNDYVYCDNKNLEYLIKNCSRGNNKLYPHEIVMLRRVSYGGKTEPGLDFNFYWSHANVEYPELLFFSLIERGYIYLSDNWDILPYINFRDLQKLVKRKNIKCKLSRCEIEEQVKEIYEIEELIREQKKKYYVLTDIGKKELEISNFEEQGEYRIWEIYFERFGKNKENPTIRWFTLENTRKDFFIENHEVYWLTLNKYKVCCSNIVEFDKNKDINIHINDSIWAYKNVIRIQKEWKKGLLIIVQALNHENDVTIKDNVKVRINLYDYKNGNLVLSEIIPYKKLFSFGYESNGINLFMEINKCKVENTQNRIILGDIVNYYFSVEDVLTKIIVEKYFSKHCEVTILPKIIDDDSYSSYKILVKQKDKETQRMIFYLYHSLNKIKCLGIKGYDLNYILTHYGKKCEYNYQKLYVDREFEILEKQLKIQLGIEKVSDLLKMCLNNFPEKILEKDYLKKYTSISTAEINMDDKFVYDNPHVMKLRYYDILNKLRLEGVLPPQWKSEYELYMLVLSYFNDSIFQYRAKWLNNQSLDIFIPSVQLGIEYQGVQHYEPIQHFGGTESFEIQKVRDKTKKEKLMEQNIKLIEWKYDIPINKESLKYLLAEKDILLPKTCNQKIKGFFDSQTNSKSPKKNINSKKEKIDIVYNIPVGIEDKILVFHKDGKFIKGFDRVVDSARYLNLNSKKIYDVLSGRNKSYKGYVWIRNETKDKVD